jgi:hypothetical protein
MRAFTSLFSVALLAMGLLPPPEVSSQVPPALQEDVLRRSATIGDVSLPAFSAFAGAVLASGVPGGVAFVQGCSDQPLPVVRPQGTTLRGVLDSITSGDPSYVWRMNEGVVNLEPLQGIPALLTSRLENYDSQELAEPGSAMTLLISSPEVTRAATNLGLAHNVSGSALSGIGPGPRSPKKPLGIRLHNVTLLDALNAVVRANKNGVWTYRETHCGSVHQYDVTFSE